MHIEIFTRKKRHHDISSSKLKPKTCKQLFFVANVLLGNPMSASFLTNILASQLSTFFTGKIKQISKVLTDNISYYIPTVVPDNSDNVRPYFHNYQRNSCRTFSLFYKHINVELLLPTLTNAINRLLLTVWRVSIQIQICSCQSFTKKKKSFTNWSRFISVKDPWKSCPDAAFRSSEFHPSDTQLSIFLQHSNLC